MKRQKYIFINLVIFILNSMLGACIDPISLKIDAESPKLVVVGVINNQDDSCVVQLSYTNAYLPETQINKNPTKPAIASKVSIQDNEGKEFILNTFSPGVYVSKSIKGKTGNTYTLYIELPDGKKYQSIPETLPEVPPVDSMNYEIFKDQRFYNGVYFTDLSLKIRAYFQDPIHKKNFYKWKWLGESTFRIMTVADYSPYNNIPLYCYYKVNPSAIDPYQEELNILDGKNIDGLAYNHPAVIFRFDSFDFRFRSGINLLIGQYAITEKAYQYWDKLRKLLSTQGSVFDPAPFQVLGNVYNVNDKTEKIFGYFGASAVTYFRYQFFVFHYKVEPCSPLDAFKFCSDCRKYDSRYSTDPPSYWIQ